MSQDTESTDRSIRVGSPAKGKGFWTRRFGVLIVNQLTQGVSVREIALTLAWGVALGWFPLFGVTSLLCLFVGYKLKLNHVILQSTNWTVAWVHPLLFLFFVRIGERVVGAESMPFVPTELIVEFNASPSALMSRFAMTLLHGILGWSLLAPVIFGVTYAGMYPILRKVAKHL
jgi:uncharacterized protein (DUF2062 family)